MKYYFKNKYPYEETIKIRHTGLCPPYSVFKFIIEDNAFIGFEYPDEEDYFYSICSQKLEELLIKKYTTSTLRDV